MRGDFGNPSFPLSVRNPGIHFRGGITIAYEGMTRWWVRGQIVMSLLLQVHTVPGVGEQPSGPIKLTWRQGQPAPEVMGSKRGSAVVHGNTAYFSSVYNVYSYTVHENKWTKLPQCKYERFAMVVINDALTTIGGREYASTNTLLSLSGSSWEEVLPPMPTKREFPAAANTPTRLVVGGGDHYGNPMATVEVLNTETLQWSTASSLPERVSFPQITTCGGSFYLAIDLANGNTKVFSCSLEDLLKSTNNSDGGSVWTRLANIPAPQMSTLATLRGRVLAIGGTYSRYNPRPTGSIHCYDVATNSWSVLLLGEMPTPRYWALTAVLPSNELVVVGGVGTGKKLCATTEIATC